MEIKLNMKIESLIKNGESETVEFKQGFSMEQLKWQMFIMQNERYFLNNGQCGHHSDIIRTFLQII